MTYATTFVQNSIRGDTLEDLDKGDLREMRITALGDIKRILKHAKKVDKKDISLKYHDFAVGSASEISSQMEGCLKTENIKREEAIIEIDLDEDSERVQAPNPLYREPLISTQVKLEDTKKEQLNEIAIRTEAEAPKGKTLAKDTVNKQITEVENGTARAGCVSLGGSMPVIVNVEGAHEMETEVPVVDDQSDICGEINDDKERAPAEDLSLNQEKEQYDSEEDAVLENVDNENVDNQISKWMQEQEIDNGGREKGSETCTE